jgi:hypothetical protein
VELAKKIPSQGLQIAGNPNILEFLKYTPKWYNMGLMELFGLITVNHGISQEGMGWAIERINNTPFGDAVLALLKTGFSGISKHILEQDSGGTAPIGILQPLFKPYFAKWASNLTFPSEVIRKGAHIFKVTLFGMWCRFAVTEDTDLDTFASTILAAVGFGEDHLYQFSFCNRFGVTQQVHHPYMDEGPWTSEVLVGELPLSFGQSMTFLFDFGDNWEFDVCLERIDGEIAINQPLLIDKHGDPPQQYPSCEE